MSFIRYKKFGNKEYAYEITAYWDPTEKKPRQRTKYLGAVINKRKRLYQKRYKLKDEKLILDFGNTYLIEQFLKKIKFSDLLERAFGHLTAYLLALICYRLCYPSAMVYAKTWYEGNIAQYLFKSLNISSQRISDFLREIANESLQRKFFAQYVRLFTRAENGIIIDTTALPNQIHLPFTAWGYHAEEIDKQIKFLLVVDRSNSLPLFFRYLPGNIIDVSTLSSTREELRKYGIGSSFVFIDGGFFSEQNIKELYTDQVPFLTRLPCSRRLYKQLIEEESEGLEKVTNAVRYGKRALFIKQKTVNLFGKRGYAYLVLDPERRGREIKKFLLETIGEKSSREVEYQLKKKGIMILVSSFKLSKEEVVPLYYLRQTAEKLFGFAKDDLKLVPLRVHGEETLRGLLFLSFLSLVTFVLLKEKLGKAYTVEEALLVMRSLKCKVYEDEILIPELTKQQKEIIGKLKILVPKKLGI